MKIKRAFTLAEAILTMTILGVIAAVMITTLKPSAYKSQGFTTMKQKIYNELDNVSQTILVECCKNMSFASVYTDTASTPNYSLCTKTFSTTTFDANIIYKYANYMRGTVNSSSCANTSVTESNIANNATASKSYTKAGGMKLRNGACMWVRAIASSEDGYYNATTRIGSILIDVNGTEGPNAMGDGNDRVVLYIGKDGIESDMPKN